MIIKELSKIVDLTRKYYLELIYQLKLKAPVINSVTSFRLNNEILKCNEDGFYEVVNQDDLFSLMIKMLVMKL